MAPREDSVQGSDGRNPENTTSSEQPNLPIDILHPTQREWEVPFYDSWAVGSGETDRDAEVPGIDAAVPTRAPIVR